MKRVRCSEQTKLLLDRHISNTYPWLQGSVVITVVAGASSYALAFQVRLKLNRTAV